MIREIPANPARSSGIVATRVENSRVGRRYAGGRLDRRGALLMSASAGLRFSLAGVARLSAGLLR